MRSGQWTRAEAAVHRQKLLESYKQLLSDLSSPELHVVGNYTLGRLIGKGSFGKVYLASHRLMNGSKVVLKSARRDDPNLAREIHHHRQFVHPHIARLYEVILTETLVWLVLEYCPGDELLTYVANHGRIEPEKVQKIFTQLIGAVSYVHGKRCVHRDLKLENILLDKTGNVKLVDFGFTREYEGKNSVLQTWCGTVCYSAPEMLNGEKYSAEKVDVWSLGVILYALLIGELPFDCEDEGDTRKMIVGSEPVYPDYLPAPAASLIKKMLAKRPFIRPSLDDILSDPWLSDYAIEQRAILSRPIPLPFSTEIEHETLLRMRTVGIDVNLLMENVTSQKCDPLSGWWALLLEKETRKAARRERRLLEREKTRRVSIAHSVDRVVSPLRLDTSRSRRGSRFGAESFTAAISNTSSPTAVLEHNYLHTPKRAAAPVPTPSSTSVPTPSKEPATPGYKATPSDSSPVPTPKTALLVPELSFSSHSPVSSPPRATGLPLLGHLKQWLRHTTRSKDPQEPSPPRPQISAAVPERRRLGFSAAGFRFHRERKRGPSPPGSYRIPMCGDSDPPSRSSGSLIPPTAALIPPTPISPATTAFLPRPLSDQPETRPSSRGRPMGSRLAVPATVGSPGVSGRPLPRQRSISGSSPLRNSHSHARRRSSLRGRKSASSSLSSIRSLRPHPSHSKASSTSSTTTTMTNTTSMTVGAGGGSLPALSPGGSSSNVSSVPVSIATASRIARASRLASPISAPPGGMWRSRRGRSLSSGSGTSTPSTSLSNLATLGSGSGGGQLLSLSTMSSNTGGLSDPFFRSGAGISSPVVRKRPGALVLSSDLDYGRSGTPPLSPGLAITRRRPSTLQSGLSQGLGLNLPGGGFGPLALGTPFVRSRRKRSGRAAIIEEQEEEDEEGEEEGSGGGIEEVDEFEELEPGEEVCYHDSARFHHGRSSIDMRVDISSATMGVGDISMTTQQPDHHELAHSPPDSPVSVITYHQSKQGPGLLSNPIEFPSRKGHGVSTVREIRKESDHSTSTDGTVVLSANPPDGDIGVVSDSGDLPEAPYSDLALAVTKVNAKYSVGSSSGIPTPGEYEDQGLKADAIPVQSLGASPPSSL